MYSHPFDQPNELPSKIIRYIIYGIVGSFLGAFVSVTTNYSLLELSQDFYFGIYFAVIFGVSGLIVRTRLQMIKEGEPQENTYNLLYATCIFFQVSGICCILLAITPLMNSPVLIKMPIYAFIGAGFAFFVIYTIIDGLNLFCGFLRSREAKAIINSPKQIKTVMLCAMILGLQSSVVFSFAAIETYDASIFESIAYYQNLYTCPFSFFLGALAGVVVKYLRFKEKEEWLAIVDDVEI